MGRKAKIYSDYVLFILSLDADLSKVKVNRQIKGLTQEEVWRKVIERVHRKHWAADTDVASNIKELIEGCGGRIVWGKEEEPKE